MLLQLCDNHGSTEGPRGATSVARRRAASESIDSDLDLGVQNKTDDEKTRGAGSRGAPRESEKTIYFTNIFEHI